jgi:hypothetical protein
MEGDRLMTDDGIDFGRAARILEEITPELTELESDVKRGLPDLNAEAVSDAALARALARLQTDLNRDTVEYLAWKTRSILAAARRTISRSRAARYERTGVGSSPLGEVRTFIDPDGEMWTAFEVSSTPAHPERGTSLVFTSETMWRRVTQFPAEWRTLTDAQLAALSWQR